MTGLRKASLLQNGSFIVFLAASVVGVIALIQGIHWLVATNVVLMIANFAIYQISSNIVREELQRTAALRK